jgi:hypothetical protein
VTMLVSAMAGQKISDAGRIANNGLRVERRLAAGLNYTNIKGVRQYANPPHHTVESTKPATDRRSGGS